MPNKAQLTKTYYAAAPCLDIKGKGAYLARVINKKRLFVFHAVD